LQPEAGRTPAVDAPSIKVVEAERSGGPAHLTR
jgi:hypothetical protein